MINQRRAEQQLELHEGLRLKCYLDTEGNWTLGIGYNVSSRGLTAFENVIKRSLVKRDYSAPGLTEHDIAALSTAPPTQAQIESIRITEAEARKVLRADLTRVEQAVIMHWPHYNALSEVRQRVIVDMAFNMGFAVQEFKKAKAAVEAGDWSAAARELYRSKWAGQVGDGPGGKFDRADRLAKMLLTNNDFTE